MEPGHEDREYVEAVVSCVDAGMPQWSPVMKTGNTPQPAPVESETHRASMEPGHEDREYVWKSIFPWDTIFASMEPGHEDREYAVPFTAAVALSMPQWSPVMKTGNTQEHCQHHTKGMGLNGARS